MRAGRPWAWPVVLVYAAALVVMDGLRKVGVLRTRRLKWPVVSAGSLSAGGAGKTPVVIALAELMRERSWAVDVLSRGYGRSGRGVERVNPGVDDAAGRYGDEPVLIARRAGVPVWVGAERYSAGVMAEGDVAEQGRGLHLLDDGFQHRQLARNVDVVLVTEQDMEDALLPAGNRREGLAALRRADIAVVREDERERVEDRLRPLLRADAKIWIVTRRLCFDDPAGASCAGSRPMAFCAIARPEGFWAMLAEAGCEVVEKVAFGDHHAYGMADIERIAGIAKECGATGFLITEKDGVKLTRSLPGSMMERLRAIGPVCVVGLEARFLDEVEVARELEARIS